MGKAKGIYSAFLVRYCVVIVVMLLGALMFRDIENDGITKSEQKLKLVRDRIKSEMEDLRQSLSETLNVSIESVTFEKFATKIKELEFPKQERRWDLMTGTQFAFTIMSTIGYGQIVPKTNLGKITCMLYGIISIPVFLYALAAAGEVKRFHIEKLMSFFERKFLKHNEIKRKNQKTIVITIFLFTVEITMAAGIEYHVTNWNYLDCLYFWFITASSIGFGDLVISESTNVGVLLLHLFFVLALQSGLATFFSTVTDMLAKRAVRIRNSVMKISTNTEQSKEKSDAFYTETTTA